MPPAKKSNNKVEVVLTTLEHKKHSVRFIDPMNANDDVTNLYLKLPGFTKIGSPKRIKITVEAADDE